MSATIITDCTVLDGTAQMQPQTDRTIVIDGENILSVSNTCPETGSGNIFRLMGHYILPGLIDLKATLSGAPVRKLGGNPLYCAHLRLKCSGKAQGLVMNGVTTVAAADCGGAETLVRDWIGSTNVEGARVLAGGISILPKGAAKDVFAPADADEARGCIERLSAAGKPELYRIVAACQGKRMDSAVLKACCGAAVAAGGRTIVYADEADAVREALQYGVAAIEHGARMDEETAGLYRETGTALLTSVSGLVLQGSGAKRELALAVSCAQDAAAYGIPVGLGSGSGENGVASGDMWRELYWYAKLTGVGCAAALHSATAVNAKIAGLERRIGRIEPDMCADLFVTDRSPLEDMTALREPTLLFVRGVALTPPRKKKNLKDIKLDRLL